VKKTLVIIIHVLAVLAFTTAFSALYLASQDSDGISWISAPDYQDSPQFAEAFNSDVTNVKRLAFLRDAFGEQEVLFEATEEAPVVVEAVKGDEAIELTAPMILKLAESFGDTYSRKTNQYQFSNTEVDIENYTVRVTYKSYDPDFLEYVTPGPSQGTMTIRALCQEVITYLSEYMALTGRYGSPDMNFRYTVYYPSEKEDYVVVSNSDLPPESVAKLGKYVIVQGADGEIETNVEPVPAGAAYTPLINRDPEFDDYYMLVAGVDTAYPYADDYRAGAELFRNEVNRAYTWIAVGVVSFVLIAITMVLLLREASLQGSDPESVHLFDRLPYEVFVIMMAILAVIFYFCFKGTLCRVVEGISPFAQEQYWRSVAKGLITYGLIILILRSAVRRYRKGELYKNSMFNRMELAIENYLEHLSLSAGLFVRFLAFTFINVGGTVGAIWLYITRETDSRRILIAAVLMAAILIIDALVYNALFKVARQREMISQALKDISCGDTDVDLEEKKFSGNELDMVKDINHISVGLSTAVRDQVKSERMKADLITNVSHDIKTPLTSIISYVGLLKREEIKNEKALEYIDVLERKSERLKKLIEDLVEASKASSGNVKIELAKIDLGELTEQAAAEFDDKFAKRNLEFCFTQPETPVYVNADGRHLWRVFDNLLNNASKYSLEGTRVYGDVTVCPAKEEGEPGTATFTIKNISASKLNIGPDELTERFVRGDVSRTTEGSGLGLSIATSLCSLMGGELKIEIDGDLYKANVTLPLYRETEEETVNEEV